MELEKKVCAVCKKEFTPTRYWQRFCSKKCRNDFRVKETRAARQLYKKRG